MKQFFLISVIAIVLASTHNSFAADRLTALREALVIRNNIVSNLSAENFGPVAAATLDILVNESIKALRAHGDAALADELQSEWQHRYRAEAFQLGQDVLNPMEVGDHKPLFVWLESFFVRVEEKLGDVISAFPMLQDIRTMNFVIPVVFTPLGIWREGIYENDRIEYRKHFIPFANIVTYWSVLEGCLAILAQNQLGKLKKVCTTAANYLRKNMGRYIAPPIADWVFAQANNKKCELILTGQKADALTLEDLSLAVQQ